MLHAFSSTLFGVILNKYSLDFESNCNFYCRLKKYAPQNIFLISHSHTPIPMFRDDIPQPVNWAWLSQIS
jgi:hypothetical protein